MSHRTNQRGSRGSRESCTWVFFTEYRPPRRAYSIWQGDPIVWCSIEAVCSTDDEVREQIRLTVIHEFGHYFGMDEDQLKDV
jgi:hypothetical protein